MALRPLVTARDLRLLLTLYPLRFLAEKLPHRVFNTLCRLMVPIYVATAFKPRRLSRSNIARAFKLSPSDLKVRNTTRQFLRQTALRNLTQWNLNRLDEEGKLRCEELSGREHLDKALAAGKGVMVVGGHFRANLIAKRYLAHIGYPMLSIRDSTPPNPYLGYFGRRFLKSQISTAFQSLVKSEVLLKDPDCSLQILGRLRRGGIVNVNIDALRTSSSIVYPFLGTNRPFSTGFVRIALHARCALVCMLCLADNRGIRIRFDPLPEVVEGTDEDELVSTTMSLLVSNLESQILNYPDQWTLWVVMDQHSSSSKSTEGV